MRSIFLRRALAALVFLLPLSAHAAIPASERQALLTFFESTGGSGWNDKRGWGDAPGTECSWRGITCNSVQDSVTEIWLDGNNLTGSLPAAIGGLPNLEVLYLANNSLTGQLPAELLTLTKLRTIGLSRNVLGGEIPASIGALTNLEHLELAENGFSGELPQSLAALTKLQSLTLYSNAFSGEIPPFIGSLSQLTYVSLGNNDFTGVIPSTLGGLTKLQELYLDENQLEGGIPAELGSLSALEILRLDYNSLTGAIPTSLGALSNLKILALGANELTGAIPSELGNLAQLQRLELYFNALSGAIPSSLGNLSRLEALLLEGNQLSGSIPKELGSLALLQNLWLGSNVLTGALPEELGNLSALEELTVEFNDLSGVVPASFARLVSLRKFDVSFNRINGPLPDLSALINLNYLAVSGNPIGGGLPLWVANLPAIEGLYFDEAELTGTLPAEYARIKTLRDLYVSGNELTGEVPQWIGDLPELRVLLLAGNRFSGTLPASITRLSNLSYLHLGDNRLHGELPQNIGDLQQLQYFEINGNAFSGAVPQSFSTMKNLVYVVFSGNEFTGEFPSVEGFNELTLLNLSVNHFTGGFPVDMTRLPKLEILSLGGNAYKGALPNEIGDFPVLQFLGLWSNGFVGEIPASITKLTQLAAGELDLNHNGLYTNNAAVREFVDAKHYPGAEWQSTQTVAPTDVTVGEVTDRSVEISWKPIAYIHDQGGYRVSAARTPGGAPVVVVTTAEKESSSIVVRGLEPETTYHFTVAAVTHPHDYQQNLIVSTGTPAVSARTSARVLAPAEVVITRTPSGLIQIGGVPQNEDAFILTNFGDQPSSITLHRGSETFYTATPLTFTLAGGASQRIQLTSIAQPAGSYGAYISVSGDGVPADTGVYFELLSVAAATGGAVGEAVTSRIDISGAADATSVGSATFANRGSAELSGVLVSDVPWIIVTPGIVTIPPNELRTVNFTVDRSKRSRDIARGTATGIISLVYVDGSTQKHSADDIRALSSHPPGVSIAIVTVVDTAKPPTGSGAAPALLPQEVARFIAGVRTIDLAAHKLVSDLSIANTVGVATSDDVRLYFTAPNAATASVANLGAVSGGEAVSLSNVVASVYNGAPNGSLQLRSESWDKLTVAAALNAVSGGGNNIGALPVFRSDRSARADEKLHLVGIGKSATARGDLLVQETSGQPAVARVAFLDASGAAIGSPLQLSVSSFALGEALDAVPAGAVTAVVSNDGPGSIVAYVQMMDTASGDAWSVVDWSRYFGYRTTDDVRIPVATRDAGAARRARPVRRGQSQANATVTTQSATDLYIFNSDVTEAAARLRYIDRTGAIVESEVSVPPMTTLLIDDVLLRRFNRSGRADGAIIATVVQGSLVFSSRTRISAAGVARGSAIPVVAPKAGLRLGEAQVFAAIADAKKTTIDAAEAGTYKTSLLLQETSGEGAKVRVSLLFADGKAVVASNIARDYDIAPDQTLSLERVSREIIGAARDSDYDDLFGMQLQVRVIDGEGSILPLAVVTENASGDTMIRIE